MCAIYISRVEGERTKNSQKSIFIPFSVVSVVYVCMYRRIVYFCSACDCFQMGGGWMLCCLVLERYDDGGVGW